MAARAISRVRSQPQLLPDRISVFAEAERIDWNTESNRHESGGSDQKANNQ